MLPSCPSDTMAGWPGRLMSQQAIHNYIYILGDDCTLRAASAVCNMIDSGWPLQWELPEKGSWALHGSQMISMRMSIMLFMPVLGMQLFEHLFSDSITTLGRFLGQHNPKHVPKFLTWEACAWTMCRLTGQRQAPYRAEVKAIYQLNVGAMCAGAEEIMGLGELNELEQKGLDAAIAELTSSVEKGVKFAKDGSLWLILHMMWLWYETCWTMWLTWSQQQCNCTRCSEVSTIETPCSGRACYCLNVSSGVRMNDTVRPR